MVTNKSKKSLITQEDYSKLALDLDSLDELAHFRAEFLVFDDDLIYMDGNSLGRLPKRSAERAVEVVSGEWGKQLIRSWGINWYEAPQRVGAKIARLVGAADDEVVVSDSTTNNLFKVILAALKLQTGRTKIVTDEFNFPSDHYVLQGCAGLLGDQYQIVVIKSEDGITIDGDAVDAVLDEETAILVLSHVAFKSGYMYDAAKVTEMAHRKGVLVVWDLSHSAGSVIVELDQWNADFAVGCTYKYLNGGPGSPAFLYVNKQLQDNAISPIWGWFGDRRPFSFDLNYQPASGINQFLVGTPAVLSLLTMEPGVDLLLEAGMDKLRKKSIEQTSFLIECFDHFLKPLGFKLGTPREESLRGSHVSIRHQDGYRINLSLINDLNVIPDFREPDNIRMGIAPIYTRYIDIWEAVSRLSRLMQDELYKKYSLNRQIVT
jgi:kynureninase